MRRAHQARRTKNKQRRPPALVSICLSGPIVLFAGAKWEPGGSGPASEDIMAAFDFERVLLVEHWTDRLFSFRTTRNPTLRFENGQFAMIGLKVDGRPLLRAYSFASANYEEYLEFYSIKVAD